MEAEKIMFLAEIEAALVKSYVKFVLIDDNDLSGRFSFYTRKAYEGRAAVPTRHLPQTSSG